MIRTLVNSTFAMSQSSRSDRHDLHGSGAPHVQVSHRSPGENRNPHRRFLLAGRLGPDLRHFCGGALFPIWSREPDLKNETTVSRNTATLVLSRSACTGRSYAPSLPLPEASIPCRHLDPVGGFVTGRAFGHRD